MRENRTYGSVRGGQSNLIPSTRLTAALPLRVVVGALKGASINAALRQQEKPYNRPAGVEMHSPFGGWCHHLARWEACHLILSRLRLLANQVPLPPGGKHVTGFAGRLQLPYESSSFATPTSRGHYKAPLCCELLMKGSLLSHRSAGGRWYRKAPKGGKPPEVADHRNAYFAI